MYGQESGGGEQEENDEEVVRYLHFDKEIFLRDDHGDVVSEK